MPPSTGACSAWTVAILALILSALVMFAGIQAIRVIGQATAAKRVEAATFAAAALVALFALAQAV